jgi:hypothetical protein
MPWQMESLPLAVALHKDWHHGWVSRSTISAVLLSLLQVVISVRCCRYPERRFIDNEFKQLA